MPLYQFKCAACGNEEAIFRKVDERDNFAVCACGSGFQRVLAAPMLRPEIAPYRSPNGKWITSRAERREDLARSHAIEWEPGIERDIASKRESLREQSFAPIAKAVDEITANMVSTGKLSA